MMNLSKPEKVRERVYEVCANSHWTCQYWLSRKDGGRIFMHDFDMSQNIKTVQDAANVRIDDIMFGHPCGISIA